MMYSSIRISWLIHEETASESLDGQADRMALTKVARGIAKKTPHNPHSPPKNKTAITIATGCKLTAHPLKLN